MRGDQLSQQRQLIRAIEANPKGMTVAEITKQTETGIRSIYCDLEALLATVFLLCNLENGVATSSRFYKALHAQNIPKLQRIKPVTQRREVTKRFLAPSWSKR